MIYLGAVLLVWMVEAVWTTIANPKRTKPENRFGMFHTIMSLMHLLKLDGTYAVQYKLQTYKQTLKSTSLRLGGFNLVYYQFSQWIFIIFHSPTDTDWRTKPSLESAVKSDPDPTLIRNEKKSTNKKFRVYSRIYLNENISSVNHRILNLLILVYIMLKMKIILYIRCYR